MKTNENLLNFLRKLAKDKSLMTTFFSQKTPSKMYKFALNNSEGGFSQEELMEMLSSIANYIENKLSEKDLENIAGGTDESWHRSAALLTVPIASFITTGASLFLQWKSANHKYALEEDNKELSDLEREKKILEEKIKIKELEKQLNH